MYPHLFSIPIWVFAAAVGAAVGATFGGKSNRASIIGGLIGALIAAVVAYLLPVGHNVIPVQGYGVMILIGFSLGVAFAEQRLPALGIKPLAALDMGLTGAFLGIAGARIFYILMTWNEFNPFASGTFDASKITKMFAIWEGGLVFYGAFLVAIPWAYIYCTRNKIPKIPFMDASAPGLIIGQAFGRIGCFLTGCCFGRTCDLPWAVHFPPNSAPYDEQVRLGQLAANAARSAAVHPTQLYASIAGFLTWGFLYTYWPRRKYDGQILSLTLIMAGATRFFEEMLRNDDAPPLPSISDSITIAQWLAIPIMLTGFGLMFYFRKKNELYVPPANPPMASEAAPVPTVLVAEPRH